MATIGANLQAVKERITRAAVASGRHPQDIALIAVSKSFGADAVSAAYEHGQRVFGESYVQEALEKSAGLPGLLIDWHFIGPIQSNKTRPIAENFAWVHSVDRLKIAERLSAARPARMAPLQICLQVNIGGEDTKGGVAPADAFALARAVTALPRIELRGLMAIPPVTPNQTPQTRQRSYFAELRKLKDELVAAGLALDTLSMGMSDDLEAGVAEGATLVRVGTAIFGERINLKTAFEPPIDADGRR